MSRLYAIRRNLTGWCPLSGRHLGPCASPGPARGRSEETGDRRRVAAAAARRSSSPQNGMFVAAEFSLITVERSQVEERARDGDRAAGRILKGLRTLSFQLSGAQLGITITSLVAGHSRNRRSPIWWSPR
ncbi:CNNM domain-containing protein [Yinghuangia aomiensis]